jgi:hypothetical protein
MHAHKQFLLIHRNAAQRTAPRIISRPITSYHITSPAISLHHFSWITGRTFETVSSGVESSVSAVTRWKFFSDENHWENGFWEQKIKALQNLKQSDFSNQNLENLNKQVLATLESAGKRFTDQYEASRSRSYSTLGLQDSFNFAEVKNYDVYSRNLAAFQMNMKTASETAISLTDTIVKNGGAAVQELSKLKETSVQLLTQELLSNDYL